MKCCSLSQSPSLTVNSNLSFTYLSVLRQSVRKTEGDFISQSFSAEIYIFSNLIQPVINVIKLFNVAFSNIALRLVCIAEIMVLNRQ